MINDYKNIPCVVRCKGVVYKTSKPLSFFSKHREMNIEDTEIFYIEDSIIDRSKIDRALSEIENSLLGKSIKIKECVNDEHHPYTYTYRLNVNTVLCAYNKDDLDKLKKCYNVYEFD